MTEYAKAAEESYQASLHLRRYLDTIQGGDRDAATANALFAELCVALASEGDGPAGVARGLLDLVRYAFVAGVNSGLPARLPTGGN